MIVHLRELTDKITKGTTPSNIGADFTEEGIMYFRSELIGRTKYVDKSKGLLFISPETHEKLKRSQIQENDLLFSMAGVYLGKVSIVGKDDVPSNTNQAVALIRFKKDVCNIEYIYYYMKQNWFNEMVCSFSAQAAQPNINLEQIGKLKIQLVDRKLQNKIVEVLSEYDALIENNNKRIKTLEQMAENLYKEWFVRFRFPGHEKAKFEDGIPKGWKIVEIGRRFHTVLGGTPSREKPEYWNGKIPWINSGEVNKNRIIHGSEYITKEGYKKSATELLPAHSTIIAITGATLGQVSFTEIEVCTNQSVVGIYDESGKATYFLFGAVKNCIWDMINYASGGAQQHINKDVVNKYKIMLPNEEILKKYEMLVSPIFDEVTKLMLMNDNLIKQRELLLPRLMSGKLQVK